MPRPSKLDDLTAQRIYKAVERGLPRNTAAKLAMISPRTLYEWLARGRDGDPEYVQFAHRVKEAESKGEDVVVGYLREHARTSVPACIFLLSRRNPKAWGEAGKAVADAAKPALATSSEERIALLESLMAAERSATG